MLRKLTLNDEKHLENELKDINISSDQIEKIKNRSKLYKFKTDEIAEDSANIIKKLCDSTGVKCFLSDIKTENINSLLKAILIGNKNQYNSFIEESKDYDNKDLNQIKESLNNFFSKVNNRVGLRIGDQKIDLSNKTLIMGILNVTPDSFSDGGEHFTTDRAVEAALKMEEQGADIIDIGGESTRPGSSPVPLDEELSRVIPVIKKLNNTLNIPISIDTYKSQVAEKALKEGVEIVNDISGLNFDDKMAKTIADYNATVILMHIKGKPKNMQKNPTYENMIEDILTYLRDSIDKAKKAGISKDKIVVDPGIGFGKKWQKNYALLRYLEEFQSLGFPILIGPSRKSFIGKLLDLPPNKRLEGTIASVTAGIMNGANIVRVHDVKELNRAVKITDSIVGKN